MRRLLVAALLLAACTTEPHTVEITLDDLPEHPEHPELTPHPARTVYVFVPCFFIERYDKWECDWPPWVDPDTLP